MKITVNIDCTPQEARELMGLPDVKAVQDEMMEELRSKLMKGITGTEPAELLRMFMPAAPAFEQMQDFFTAMMGSKRNS